MSRFCKTAVLILASVIVAPNGLRAEEKNANSTTNVTEGSFVSLNGNTKSTTIAGKHTFTHKWTINTFEASGGGLGARDSEGVTAEKYFGKEKLEHKISDKNYLFERYQWDKDRFTGIQNRHDAQVGLGRDLLSDARQELNAELGGGYSSEERIHDKDKDYTSGRAYGKYLYKLSELSKFTQDAEYIQSLEDGDDFRVNTETVLMATLAAHLALKLSYTWKYVAQPPKGFGRNDTTTLVSLVATY